MTKIAIALYVRNEVSDISGWIAYHIAIGINSIFIFDDQSSDGTYEIIKAASKKFDIRYFITDRDSITDHDVRHRECLKYACELAKGNFDWIGFLDADEYFYYDDESIGSFFSRFDGFQGIAINWCIYGSSGLVVKPRMPTVDAFRYRSTENFSENVLVKSFIKPENFGREYHGPHRFFGVDSDKYVCPNGEVVRWDGSCNRNVSWKHARIMHYVCRSMEHYVDRIKRRLGVDLSDSMAYWDLFNINDVFDFCCERFLSKTYRNVAIIQESLLKEFIFEKENSAKHLNKLSFSLRTLDGQRIFFNKTSKRMVYASDDYEGRSDLVEVKSFIFEEYPNFLHFSFSNHSDKINLFPMTLEGDRRQSSVITYKIEFDEDPNIVSIRDPISNTYISSIDFNNQKEGILKTGKRFKDNESKFIYFSEYIIRNNNINYLSYKDLFLNIGIDNNIYDIICLSNMLNDNDKKHLINNFPGIFNSTI